MSRSVLIVVCSIFSTSFLSAVNGDQHHDKSGMAPGVAAMRLHRKQNALDGIKPPILDIDGIRDFKSPTRNASPR